MNSAPIRDPRRHFTRQRLPDPADLDKRRRKIPATESVPSMTICTPVSERSTTVQGRTANPLPIESRHSRGSFCEVNSAAPFVFEPNPSGMPAPLRQWPLLSPTIEAVVLRQLTVKSTLGMSPTREPYRS
jgi:hypothetical protein